MSLRVAVDFGTSSTCVVASLYGREPQVVMIDGHPLLPSSVFCAEDGTLFVGREAERQAAVDPARYEPNPKRRIDEGELLLGTTVVPVLDAIRAVLERAVSEARRLGGGADVDLLVLTHPADWGVLRTRVLRQAAAGLGNEITLLPEPVAAALFHAATFTPSPNDRTVEFSDSAGDVLAVLDMGAGTVDVSVVKKESGPGSQAGYRVLATKGDPSFGGADIDQALLEFIGGQVAHTDPEAWRALMEARTLGDRRRRRVLRQDVRGAKETLSRHAYTDVPMPPPFADAHVTREDLERLIAGPLGRAVEMTAMAIDEAGLRPKQLTGVFLVGGTSRIPMVARLIHERLGIVPITWDQPETVVARGAMLTVLSAKAEPARSRQTITQPTSAAHADATVPATTPVPPGHGSAAAPTLPATAPATPTTPSGGFAQPATGPRRAVSGGHRPPVSSGSGQPPASPSGAAQPAAARSYAPVSVAGYSARVSAGSDGGKDGVRKKALIGAGVLALVAVVVAGVVLLMQPKDDDQGEAEENRISAFGYSFTYPENWTQTDTVQEDKQVAIRPEGEEDGPNFVSVQRFDIGYDYEDNRDRFITELQNRLEETGRNIKRFKPDDVFAGRPVITYIETSGDTATVWLVIAKDDKQLSIGCQWGGDAREKVESACEQVVRTIRFTGE
jgi:type VII secretion-associated protein (TIGR03931 family)